MYTHLVKPGILTLDRLIEMMAIAPRRRFGIPLGTDFCVWDLGEEWTVHPEEFLSQGRATPFAGDTLQAKCCLTVCDGKAVYRV